MPLALKDVAVQELLKRAVHIAQKNLRAIKSGITNGQRLDSDTISRRGAENI
ncbi:hypothetical protein Plhal304r1_c055g0140591 [Plasmopara halstedii]